MRGTEKKHIATRHLGPCCAGTLLNPKICPKMEGKSHETSLCQHLPPLSRSLYRGISYNDLIVGPTLGLSRRFPTWVIYRRSPGGKFFAGFLLFKTSHVACPRDIFRLQNLQIFPHQHRRDLFIQSMSSSMAVKVARGSTGYQYKAILSLHSQENCFCTSEAYCFSARSRLHLILMANWYFSGNSCWRNAQEVACLRILVVLSVFLIL